MPSTKTLRVTLSDIVGGTGGSGSTAVVRARYVTSNGQGRDVHLASGTIVVPVRREVTPGTGPEVFDFTVIPSDDADVREVDRGFLTEVSWTVTAPEGGKSHGVRRVLITADMGATVHLGLLAQPEPVAPYTGGYALAPDLAAEVVTRAAADTALDGRVDALEVAPPAHTHTASQVSDSTTTGRALLTATDAAAARTTLALGTAATTAATAYATAVQGVKADAALQPNTVTGLLAGNGTTTTGRTITGTADEITVTNGSGASGNPTLSLALTAAKVGALPIPDPGSFYPTDTITAALQLIGGRERYGTGSPEGVVTAPVGTYYTDTAITNGALRWAKKAGAGNTGWQVVEGDTGWRDVRTLLLNGWTATIFQLRRRNDTVMAKINSLSGNATWLNVMNAPTGFHMAQATYPLGRESQLTGNMVAFACSFGVLGSNWTKMIDGTWNSALYSLVMDFDYQTEQAWPTTLPGVAA